MIDIHCHILPDFDDGSTCMAESLDMARMAVASGVRGIVTTPHFDGEPLSFLQLVMARFGIASVSPLERWCKVYREGGPEALRPKPKGRPRGASPAPAKLTREQELERRIQKLEAENAYLKKSIALKAEKRSRTAKKPRS